MITLDRLNRKEAIRYLGGAGISLNYRMDVLMDECEKKILKTAEPRFLYLERKAPFDDILLGNDIKKHLEGCHTAVMMCATIGSEIDKLIRISQISDMARAVVLQACAAAELEEYCDEQQKKISTELEKSGLYLRPRFSPGYGDFPIEFQEPIMRMLDCAKKIGLTMTDSYMMSPTKSVTAIIGISTEKERCPISGCEACGKKDCAYRR